MRKVGQSLFRLFCWSPNFNVKKESTTTTAWVRLPGLPPEVFAPSYIASIVASFGCFLAVDDRTRNMSNPSCARACVEIDLAKFVPSEVIINVIGDRSIVQPIVFEGKLLYCSKCKIHGHQFSDYRKVKVRAAMAGGGGHERPNPIPYSRQREPNNQRGSEIISDLSRPSQDTIPSDSLGDWVQVRKRNHQKNRQRDLGKEAVALDLISADDIKSQGLKVLLFSQSQNTGYQETNDLPINMAEPCHVAEPCRVAGVSKAVEPCSSSEKEKKSPSCSLVGFSKEVVPYSFRPGQKTTGLPISRDGSPVHEGVGLRKDSAVVGKAGPLFPTSQEKEGVEINQAVWSPQQVTAHIQCKVSNVRFVLSIVYADCDAMVAAGVSDAGYKGNPFTWSNNQNGADRIWERLDRALLNGLTLAEFPRLQVSHLEQICSDHCPLLIELRTRQENIAFFHYQGVWETHSGFTSTVCGCWEGSMHHDPLINFGLKLKRLRLVLRKWNWEVFGDIRANMRGLLLKINVLEARLQQGWNDMLAQEVAISKGKYQDLADSQYAMLKAKAKMKWLEDGEHNSKLFHAAIKARRVKNKM
ncbi:hypothetical protein QQ045_000580 [Rhodiola kirilowii]